MKRVLASLGISFGVVAPSNSCGLSGRAGSFAGPCGTGFERTVISSSQEFDDNFGRPTQSKFKMEAAGLRSLTQPNLSQPAFRRATVNGKHDCRLVGESVSRGSGAVQNDSVSPRRFSLTH